MLNSTFWVRTATWCCMISPSVIQTIPHLTVNKQTRFGHLPAPVPEPRLRNKRCWPSPSTQTRPWRASCHPRSPSCWPRAEPWNRRAAVGWAAAVWIMSSSASQIRLGVNMRIERATLRKVRQLGRKRILDVLVRYDFAIFCDTFQKTVPRVAEYGMRETQKGPCLDISLRAQRPEDRTSHGKETTSWFRTVYSFVVLH